MKPIGAANLHLSSETGGGEIPPKLLEAEPAEVGAGSGGASCQGGGAPARQQLDLNPESSLLWALHAVLFPLSPAYRPDACVGETHTPFPFITIHLWRASEKTACVRVSTCGQG